MPEENRCPKCSRPLPPGSPKGLCPACLLACGLETNTVGYTDEAQGRARWTPPTVEQIAPLFPELDILELIGRGGMGAVYKAREKQLDRLVALKILPPEIGSDPLLSKGFAQRFTHEAQAMAKLGHPNIVTIYSFGQREELYFFIMEYVDGLSLRQLLDRGSVRPKEALAIVPQICDALQYAHDRGIVHRDIKPENILLDRRGQVKIADFGLAKLVGRSEGVSPVDAGTAHGPDPYGQAAHATHQVMGTPQYMAPEQVEHPKDVDHRADIYSLGVVFYQMLTGELPIGKFEPPSRKVLIDVRLDEVVLRALEKEPARRYQQASQVRTEVETIVATQPGGGAPSQARGEPRPSPQHWKWMSSKWIPVRPWHRVVVITGVRGGKRVVNGKATAFWLALGAIFWLGGVLLLQAGGSVVQHFGGPMIGLGAAMAVTSLFGWITLDFWAPERLVPLDEPPPPTGSGSAARGTEHEAKPARARRRRWGKALLTVGVVVVAALCVRQWVLGVYWAQTDAVAPEIPKGSRVFVYKLSREWTAGDIMLYRRDGKDMLGRFLEGGPGETFRIERQGQTPQAIARADVIGKVVFNTRSAANPVLSTTRPSTARDPAGTHPAAQAEGSRQVLAARAYKGDIGVYHSTMGSVEPPKTAASQPAVRQSHAESVLGFEQKQLAMLRALAKAASVPQEDLDRQELKVTEAKMRLAQATDPQGSAPVAAVREPRRPATVFFRIPEFETQRVVKKMDAGQSLKVDVYGRDLTGLLATGDLVGIDNRIDSNTGTLGCRARVVPNEGVLLYPGQFVNVRMLVETKRGVTLIPAEAVQRGSEGLIVVYVIGPAGTVSRRRITQGVLDAGVVEITSGLSPGELVVVKAEGKLEEGTKVHYRLPGEAGLLLDRRVQSCEEQYRIAQERYRAGQVGIEDVLGAETGLLDAKIQLADAQDEKNASRDEILGMLKKIVQLCEKQRTLAQARVGGGLLAPEDVAEAEVKLLDARIRLADAQGEKAVPRDEVLGLFEKIVQFREQQYKLAKAKYGAGVADAEAVPAAEKRLTHAKIRLAQRRGAGSRGGTVQPVSPQSQPATRPATQAATAPGPSVKEVEVGRSSCLADATGA